MQFSTISLMLAVIAAVQTDCPSSDWKKFKNKCYYASDFFLEPRYIADVCKLVAWGAEPVSIHDDELNDFLTSELTDGRTHYWIGLSRADDYSDWVWSDGTSVDYTHWHSGEPSGDWYHCVFINWNSPGDWATYWCTEVDKYFLCQVDEKMSQEEQVTGPGSPPSRDSVQKERYGSRDHS